MEMYASGDLPLNARELLKKDGTICISTKNGCVYLWPVFFGEADAQAILIEMPSFKGDKELDVFLDGVIECLLYVRLRGPNKVN